MGQRVKRLEPDACCGPGTGAVNLKDFEDVAALVDRIGKKLFKIYNEFVSVLGVTPQQYSILSRLGDGGVPLNEIARLHGTAKSTITGIVDTMERNGLVSRSRGSADRRVILVRPTAKGRELRGRSLDLRAITRKCCAGVSNADLRQLKELLTRFHRQIDGESP